MKEIVRMWTKRPGYSCLIFFLVVLTGIAATQGSAGTPTEKSNVKVKTLDDYLKKLCEQGKKSEDEQDLSNFISRVSDVKRMGDLEFLPGCLRNAATKQIKQFEKDLRSCKSLLIFNPENKKESSKTVEEQIKKIDNVLKGIIKILRYVKWEEYLEYDIRILYDHLRPLGSLHLKRTEWPPGSQCSQCGDYWQTLEGINKYNRRCYRIIDNKNKKLQEIPDAIGKLKNEKQRICDLISQLKAIKSNLGRLDKDFRYYSWTKTRVSVNKILELLEDKHIKKICSKN